MLVNFKRPSTVLVLISSMYLPICNCFHIMRANSSKTTFLGGYPFLTHTIEGNSFIQGHEILSQKTRYFVAAQSKDSEILGVTVLIQCQGVTDGRTDGRTDWQTPRLWLRRAKHSAIARKKSAGMRLTHVAVRPPRQSQLLPRSA